MLACRRRERERKKKRLLGPMAAPGILFRGSLRNLNLKKNLIKREFEYIELSTKKKKVLQFLSISF